MRDLLLMRGIPGSGKSTYIKEHKLEPYTICPDNIRLMFQSPVIDPETGHKRISQENDRKVWALVNELVENKMNKGEFIVIDAMNIDISKWKKLAEKYRYRIWCKTFDVSLDECIKRNKEREEYKQVPEKVICKAYERIQETNIPKYAKEINDDFFEGIKPMNVDNYNNIYVFGDIHGCFDPINKFFNENPFDINNLYIFLGDYLDRGYQNKEVLEFLMKFTEYKNVMFLEGNHNWEKYYANDEMNKIRSREFLLNTVNQINFIDKSKIRDWCRRWIQMAYLEYNGKKYFFTHAGFGFFPGEKEFRFIPAYDMIRGGKYEEDVDKWYDEKDIDVIQIHGHRNIYEYPVDKFKKSFNLNSAVEFGEPLRIMKISKNGYEFFHYENESCKGRINPWKQENKIMYKNNYNKEESFLIELRKSSDIIEKKLKNNISSFNFNRSVFHSDKWNELNKIARGLFIDMDNYKILARSYKKFFNFNEGDKNTLEFLEQNLVFPVTGYLKYNGFLGLLSYDHKLNDLHFFSKSTDEYDFANWFAEIAINQFNKENKTNEIKEYLKNNDVTMVFEVIDPINDPHIIEYDNKEVILLDIIDNTIDFNKKSYDELIEIAQKFNMKVKNKLIIANSFDELKGYLEDESKIISDKPIEGIVFEDMNGYMFKYKMDFYTFWKKMRGIKQQIQKNRIYNLGNKDKKAKEIAEFMKNIPADELMKMSIIDVRNKFEER